MGIVVKKNILKIKYNLGFLKKYRNKESLSESSVCGNTITFLQ